MIKNTRNPIIKGRQNTAPAVFSLFKNLYNLLLVGFKIFSPFQRQKKGCRRPKDYSSPDYLLMFRVNFVCAVEIFLRSLLGSIFPVFHLLFQFPLQILGLTSSLWCQRRQCTGIRSDDICDECSIFLVFLAQQRHDLLSDLAGYRDTSLCKKNLVSF